MKRIAKPFARPIVADFTSTKDALFARLLLNERELQLFNRLASARSPRAYANAKALDIHGGAALALERNAFQVTVGYENAVVVLLEHGS